MVQGWLLPLFWFAAKVGFILFAFMWVRGTLPRFRYDQLMRLHLEGPVPGGHAEFAGDRLPGRLVFVTMDVILFLIFALIAVVCAINVVVQTHPISSAVSLIGVMGSLAILYLLLGAEFIAAAQVIVYAGAIMVLFVFVIMLLNAGAESEEGPLASWRSCWACRCWSRFLGLLAWYVQRLYPTGAMRALRRLQGRHGPGCGPRAVHDLPAAVRNHFGADPDRDPGSRRAGAKGDGLMSEVPISWFLTLSAILFALGVAGFLFRRNIITVFMSIELMLNAVNLSFVTFSYQLKKVNGHLFTFFVMVVAAAEAAVGLAIILTVFKNRQTLNIDEIDSMKN